MTVYVDGFWQLARALRALRPEISLYYPSSVSVTERPAGMTEYTMAKVAGETLASDMNQSLAPLHVTVTRLPRLPTDQTATVAAVETASPVGVMLPIVREVQSWPR
jgi:nucleoside-diphosphate-sugar epimerase